MKIIEAVKKGTLKYEYIHNQTMMGFDSTSNTLNVPLQLKLIAENHPTAECMEFGDGTLGISIHNKTWKVESPQKDFRRYDTLEKEVWHYLQLALGRLGVRQQLIS